MFGADSLSHVREDIRKCTERDKKLLDELRAEVRTLASGVRTIKPRSTTSVSLVGSDGGNNRLQFDPFSVQLVRVVDSYGKELCRDAVSPTTDTDELSARQFNIDGTARTALGQMMIDLGLGRCKLSDLSHMIPDGKKCREEPEKVSPSWVLVYRDICEWAALYERICVHKFGTDTLLVRDGLLRSKIFRRTYFIDLRKKFAQAMERIQREDHRRIFLVGVAKHSQVLARYQLAMMIENTLPPGEPRYVRMPRDLERKAYRWPEWARGEEEEEGKAEAPKFVAGDLFVVRFGIHGGDPIWAVDIFSPQAQHASEIFGYLLADAINGFPVPSYPLCLQRAHEHAQIVDWDLEILQNEVFDAVRRIIPVERQQALDGYRMTADAAAKRYE